MALDDIQNKLEELELDSEQIAEAITLIEEGMQKNISLDGLTLDESIVILKKEIRSEKNWKKRAAIAAQIISIKLD